MPEACPYIYIGFTTLFDCETNHIYKCNFLQKSPILSHKKIRVLCALQLYYQVFGVQKIHTGNG